MTWDISTLVGKVRIAIDEIVKDGFDDDFTVDADTEIRQALQYAMNQLLDEVPLEALTPVDLCEVVGDMDSVHEKFIDGSGIILLPDNFLRLVSFKLHSWRLPVHDVLDPMSDEYKRQASVWGRGSCHKPRVVVTPSVGGHLRLQYWTAGRRAVPITAVGELPSPSSPTYYDHAIDYLQYIPSITIDDEAATIDSCLNGACEMQLVYRAAGIFLEGKKEGNLAQRMYALSASITPTTPNES